jgi:DNA-binding SARP family transcriptional activator
MPAVPLEVQATKEERKRPRIDVTLMGSFEIRCNGRVLDVDKRKACAILAYLLLNGQTRETRGRLSALLWSDKDEERARASLRQSIRDLKDLENASGVEFLLADKLSVGIDHERISTDVSALRLALAERDFVTANKLLSEGSMSLCTGLQDCDPVFDNWIRTTSASWSDGLIQQLSKALGATSLTNQERASIATCILRLDPFHEAAVLEMLRSLYREGGYARAHAFYERYAANLREELDISPPREIVRLIEQFGTATNDPSGASSIYAEADPLATPIERPRIVLVTEKFKSSDAHILFALVSELTASLSRFRHWTAIQVELDRNVIESGSIEALRAAAGQTADLAVIITSGSPGDGFSFDISCRSLANGEEQFATTASSEPSTWRTVFNDICAQVASRLQVAVSSTRLHRIDEQSPNYISAYDSWLDGQRLLMLWRNDSDAAAIARYEEAIRLDPTLACAYSGLAAILNSRWIVLPGYPPESADLERAFELAKQAVMLDPLDHRTQVNLGWSHLLAKRWELADFHFGLAHDLNAANPSTLIAYALASSFSGNHQQALELSQRSFELNPLYHPHYHGYQATIAFLAGELQDCIDAVEMSDALFPDIRGWSAAAHALMGDDAKARADFRAFEKSVANAWYNDERPSRQVIIEWFKNVFPIRLKADRDRLAEGIDRAARLA